MPLFCFVFCFVVSCFGMVRAQLACMLLEQRILVHTVHYERLTPVCEALQALMFPFYWQHVYVPLLPLQYLEYLQAPVPFIMGVHTDFLSTRTAVESVASVVMVHLDFNKVCQCWPLCAPRLGCLVVVSLSRWPRLPCRL